ncbi:MAG: enoyl-CoA hydratase/isomerase family protein [Thermoanaerobaculia bacterium]|nr:enoyl-CoA hydratase/isomerase family protein [Thermoanaerobaculia bacterium]
MGYRHLRLERRGPVAVLVLDRPAKANALSFDVLEEIERMVLAFRDDAETRVVVFRGEGRHFSAGADIADVGARARATAPLVERRRSMRMGQRVLRAILEMDQISIGALHGAAMGGGACIVTALDYRVAGESFFVSYPEINLGLNLMWQGLPLCVHLVGPSKAKRLVILGQRETAGDLLAWGFVDEVVPDVEVLDRALDLAEAYAAQPPVQAQMIKRSVNKITGALDDAVMHMDFDQGILAGSTEDAARAREAYARAFDPGDKPDFEGR